MNPDMPQNERLTPADLHQLSRFNTPTIYNGWEQITRRDVTAEGFNLEELRDFTPHMSAMVGFAVTVVIEPSNPKHRQAAPDGWVEYRKYVAETQGPKIVIVQDLDKPRVIGAFWGEVCSGMHRALGCVGTITDGAVRDIDEVNNIGFKVLARRFCVGHAHVWPVRWNCPVEVFGQRVEPGQLVHADKHGFLAIPREDEARLLDAARFMDQNECRTVIPASRNIAGQGLPDICASLAAAGGKFTENAKEKFQRNGEW